MSEIKPIAKIAITDNRFAKREVHFSQFVMIVGINGGGKSKFLNLISQETPKLNHHPNFLPETYFMTSEPTLSPKHKENILFPISVIEYNDLFDQINPYLESVFKRKIITKYNPSGERYGVIKKQTETSSFDVPPIDEGFGIRDYLKLITFLVNTPLKTICIEELGAYLHPSAINSFLDIIFQIAVKKNIQIIFSTHNVVVVSYFCRKYLYKNETGSYSIKKCETDSQSQIHVTDIHYNNFEGMLQDFFSDFPSDDDIRTMRELSSKKSEFSTEDYA